ncbi:E-selectin-like isoform X3 [Dysidea avara]|uniref:E-selectin-like isoform X3 n=1 Tax=Dysidea avara TaxID=196820 RepID=UPI00332EAE28
MAKEGIAFEKFPALHQLESHHGVDIGSSYGTPQSAKLFTHYIALAQQECFFAQLSKSKFYSFLMDGSTDTGHVEQESVMALFCNKDDSAGKIKTCVRLLSLMTPDRADADGLLKCLSKSLEPLGIIDSLDKENVIGISGKPVLVGGGTDGASVNVAEHAGMNGKMQNVLPWITWSWCYAHRLELACKTALTGTLFKDVEDMCGDCITNPQQPLIQLLFDIRCDDLSTPSNGGMSCSSGRVGMVYERDTCGFTCNTGYELTGSDIRTCQSNGSWSGSDTVCRKGGVSCFDEVPVQQRGYRSIPPQRQYIFSPRANFTCNGRITGVSASMDRTVNGITDPYLEVWRPTTPDMEFNRVGAVQLAESEIVQVENGNIVYWLLNMLLNGSERIEFEAGDVIGFYQPPDTRYRMWTIATEGYTAFGSILVNSSSTFSLANPDIAANNRQPLIQFLIEIRCDNLLTPSNGGMSCSSGRVEVGYEGDTCSFTCNTGYELTGSDTRTCQNSGSWSGSESTCNMPIYLMNLLLT